MVRLPTPSSDAPGEWLAESWCPENSRAFSCSDIVKLSTIVSVEMRKLKGKVHDIYTNINLCNRFYTHSYLRSNVLYRERTLPQYNAT